MSRIASFHLVKLGPYRAPLAMARLGTDRVRLARTPGLAFWRLLGTGRGNDTGPSADLRRTAMFAVWDSPEALDAFSAESAIARRWESAQEAWHVRLRGVGGHGSWRGVDVLAGLEPGVPDGPVAIITRAQVKRAAWRSFSAAGPAVNEELHRAEGLIDVVGIGEAPVGRLGTFSVWNSMADARRFANSMPHHREVVRRTRNEKWYGEEMFGRFQPYGSSGSWGGRDPLG
jgi:heme-degrading monooxygenase HmoA